MKTLCALSIVLASILTCHAQQRIIVEGEGWDQFKLGATREELIQALGQPDQGSDGRWLQWKRKYSIHCLIDDTRGAFELRFDQGFRGKTTAGIEIGSPMKNALTAYGEPSTQEDRDGAKKLIWSSKGVLIWFSDDKTTQIVVFQKSLSASDETRHVDQSTSEGLMTRIENLEHRVTMLEQQCQTANSTNQGERASVIRTVPSRGDNNVSVRTSEITVTFSKEMGGGCSWCTAREGEYPKTTGKPRYTADKRTCILPVKLEANKTYAIWLNIAERYTNFRDTDGRPAVPYLLVFRTIE